MPTAFLRPTHVEVTSVNTVQPSSLVGGDTALSDDSDATYAEVWVSRRDLAFQDQIRAYFDEFDGMRQLNSATAYARLRITNEGSAAANRFNVEVHDDDDYVASFVHDEDLIDDGVSTLPALDTTYDVNDWTLVDLETAGNPLPAIASSLGGGTLNLMVERLSTIDTINPSDWSLRLFELGLLIDYTGARIPPLRRWPVSNGATGPVRHWPPPESRRVAGGYH